MDIQVQTNDGDGPSQPGRERDQAGKAGQETLEERLAEAQARIILLEATVTDQARARTDLIHIVSHELRTPITVISGFGRLLQDAAHGGLSETQIHFVSEMLKACRRLDLFVGDLLEAGPASGTPLSIEIAEADLDVTIRSILESMAPLFAERNLQVELDLDPLIRAFPLDAGRIEQVVTNLLTNAIRYGRPGGLIRVAAVRVSEEAARFVRVSVEDDGPGIPPENRARIFESYVQGEAGSACTGLGIGLAICDRIVASHGGSIGVEDGSLGGARFVFTLPYAPHWVPEK